MTDKGNVRKLKPSQQPSAQDSLYAAREKIYPREIRGRFDTVRRISVFVLLGLFYILPFIQWDGRQAVLFDLPERQFYIFGLIFWPQDFFYLTILLILSALGLFWVTALAGRVWCGYACPQTVWTEVFLWMEQWTEGGHSKRKKLDDGPWTREKLMRKSAKQFLWITFSLYTGFTFVAYFTPMKELFQHLINFNMGPWETFWTLFYGFATYGNAGYMREQVCKYMCPYARFQSAMFDKDTLIISYDEQRGEPRGSRKRGTVPSEAGLGDCIDCTLCVQVCPTGIDIRDGLQIECIACAACIDACDDVMDKMGYEPGLIRYSTQNAMEGKPSKLLRPRTIIYTVIFALICTAGIGSLFFREPLAMDIIRDRNALYRVVQGGMIENSYMLKVMNKTAAPHTYSVKAEGIEGMVVETEPSIIEVPPGEVRNVPARVIVSPENVGVAGSNIFLILQSEDEPGLEKRERTRFIAPR